MAALRRLEIERHVEPRTLPSRQRISHLEHELDADDVPDAESEEVICSDLSRGILPMPEHDRPIPNRGANDGSSGDLELGAAADGGGDAASVRSPLIAVKNASESEAEVRREAGILEQVVAGFAAELLQNGEAEEVRGILARELVGAPDVEWPPRPIAHSNR